MPLDDSSSKSDYRFGHAAAPIKGPEMEREIERLGSRQKPEARTAIVKRDQIGVFISHNGQTFRPDPHRLKRTPQNDMMYVVCHVENPSIGANAMLLDYISPPVGELVVVNFGQQDGLVIGAPMRVDPNSPYFAIYGGHFDEQNVTWSDETAPFRQAFH